MAEGVSRKRLTIEELRRIVPPDTVILVVYVIKRIVGDKSDINKFLSKIDEPAELENLYGALLTFVKLIQD